MSVPLTLLGQLERGPSHGYDLKRDYDTYFGRGRPLRYSQVYATLSRLARDGKAAFRPGPRLRVARDDLAIPGQAAKRGVDLPEWQLLASAEVCVVVALEVIPVAWLTFEEPEQG